MPAVASSVVIKKTAAWTMLRRVTIKMADATASALKK
jgi:hypothetical protein